MSATERRPALSALKRRAPRPTLRTVADPEDVVAARQPTPSRSPVQRCRDHIDAMYLLAYLYTGQRHTAEDVVVDVVATAAGCRAIGAAGPPWVWRILAEQIHTRGGQHLLGAEPGDNLAAARAGLSPRQREALAVVGTGRKAREAAALLGVTTTQVHRDLRAGLQDLAAALDAAGPRTGTPRTDDNHDRAPSTPVAQPSPAPPASHARQRPPARNQDHR